MLKELDSIDVLDSILVWIVASAADFNKNLSRQQLIISKGEAVVSFILDVHGFRLSMSEIGELQCDYERYYRGNMIKKWYEKKKFIFW